MAQEKTFENKIKKWLAANGCYYVKFFANGFTRRGVPDILASVGGKFVAIEVKADNGRPSDLQLDNIREIRASGGFAWVVYPSGWPVLRIILTCIRDNAPFYPDEENILESEVLK